MCPPQASTYQKYGTKSEVYTFGLILWQLCSHTRPGMPFVPEHFNPVTEQQVRRLLTDLVTDLLTYDLLASFTHLQVATSGSRPVIDKRWTKELQELAR